MYKRGATQAFNRKFNHLSKLSTMKVTFFKVLALFAVFSPLTAITGKNMLKGLLIRLFQTSKKLL